MRAAIAAAVVVVALLLGGCITMGARTVAVDVQTVDKPVPVGCTIDWPKAPVPHLSNVQLTGDALKDLVLLWRAAEAELEGRIAYEKLLEAAARKCVEGKPAS